METKERREKDQDHEQILKRLLVAKRVESGFLWRIPRLGAVARPPVGSAKVEQSETAHHGLPTVWKGVRGARHSGEKPVQKGRYPVCPWEGSYLHGISTEQP
jgi:hypothetical protein